MDCPCGRVDAARKPLPLDRCCGRYLRRDSVAAPDAESVMRSRYTAFVLRDADYLLATWHPARRPPAVEFDAAAKWLGLDVKDRRGVDDTHAEVEFVARYRLGGRAHRLHERSRFVREDGRWFYVDGIPL
jgi:SEC-C motif-containing protein